MKTDNPQDALPQKLPSPPPETMQKWQNLLAALSGLESAIVAYSGGVDSGLLAFAAHRALGARALAVTLLSELESSQQAESAAQFARQAGFPHLTLEFDALRLAPIRRNAALRCYFCKKAMLDRLHLLAAEKGYAAVIEGQNKDDENELRPGRKAVYESGARSPLAENGLRKAEIRQIARWLGLSVWNLPAAPCLATRFPYGETLTPAKLRRAAQAEDFLRQLGFETVRVRAQQNAARIEVDPQEMQAVVNRRQEIAAYLQHIGYTRISLDLLGYRRGSYDHEGKSP